MTRPSLLFGLCIAPVLLTGEATAAEWAPDSPHCRYPDGLAIRLHETLTVPPEAATVRLQYGRVVASNAVQEHDPYCIFELDTVRDTPQVVRPQRMLVTALRRSVSTFAGLPVWSGMPRHLAPVGWNDDGGPSHLYYKTEFRLRSEVQPEVRALTCQSNQLAPGIAIMRHLTLREIRQAVGGYFSLEPSPGD